MQELIKTVAQQNVLASLSTDMSAIQDITPYRSWFVIDITDVDTKVVAERLLKEYNRPYTVDNDCIIVYSTEGKDHDYRLIEMAMQWNLYQVGAVCSVCKANGEDVCGHLTFKGVI